MFNMFKLNNGATTVRKLRIVSLFVVLVLCFSIINPTVAFAAVTQDRVSFTYAETSAYRSNMQYKMNCYGYAIHVYYPNGSSTAPYKQQPGEFFNNTEEFGYAIVNSSGTVIGGSGLMRSYAYAMSHWNNLYYFVRDRVYEDFSTLVNNDSEWVITETTASAVVPSGKRKIALTICQNGIFGSDYHFYVRHSDGTWSHKPGSYPATNLSFGGVAITDANITSKVTEGGYDDGVRYFLIGKSGVVDYPHNFGQNTSTLYTSLNFKDKAGDVITKSGIASESTSAKFDYPGDNDYFKFVPSVTGTYNISTSLASSTYDTDGYVYDSNGLVIASSLLGSNLSLSVNMVKGSTYYIRVYDYKQNVVDYTLYFQR